MKSKDEAMMSDRGDFKVVKGYSRVASRVTKWAVGYSRVCTYSTMWRTAGGTEYWVLGSRWSVWQLENRLIQPLEMQFRQGPTKGVLRHSALCSPRRAPPQAQGPFRPLQPLVGIHRQSMQHSALVLAKSHLGLPYPDKWLAVNSGGGREGLD